MGEMLQTRGIFYHRNGFVNFIFESSFPKPSQSPFANLSAALKLDKRLYFGHIHIQNYIPAIRRLNVF